MSLDAPILLGAGADSAGNAMDFVQHSFGFQFVIRVLQVLQRKRRRAALKKRSLESSKAQAAEYHKLLVSRLKEQRERRWVGCAGMYTERFTRDVALAQRVIGICCPGTRIMARPGGLAGMQKCTQDCLFACRVGSFKVEECGARCWEPGNHMLFLFQL
eukprot:1145636-Pelagomonas_calceolata.AAC.3